MPRPTSNRQMADMMRGGRENLLSSYQYKGGEPKGTVIAISAKPPDPEEELQEGETDPNSPPPSPEEEMAEGETDSGGGPQLLDPGTDDPPDEYIYAAGDEPGSLMMYPPGVPCDNSHYRVAMPQPASASDIDQIQQMLDDAEGTAGPTDQGTLSQEEMGAY